MAEESLYTNTTFISSSTVRRFADIPNRIQLHRIDPMYQSVEMILADAAGELTKKLRRKTRPK